jgi:hypothetical protein
MKWWWGFGCVEGAPERASAPNNNKWQRTGTNSGANDSGEMSSTLSTAASNKRQWRMVRQLHGVDLQHDEAEQWRGRTPASMDDVDFDVVWQAAYDTGERQR